MDAIGKLTGGIAHDFNNLLAAVIGGLSLIERRSKLESDQRKVLAMTKRAAEQGSELVRRLLAFARRQKLEPHAIDLVSLKDSVSDLLAHTLGGLVSIEWAIGRKAWSAFADQAQLELALVNLIINARDAMPAGGTVRIRADNRKVEADDSIGLAAGDYVCITVADTGSGIAPDVIEKVMEPFFTTKDVGKGSGLGLSMVYGFANQSNGAIRIESEVGAGTTAELWLPRAPNRAPRGDRPRVEPKRRGRARKFRIMLVDDHSEVRTATAAVLEDSGHEVIQAANGAAAIDLLEARDCDYDLLITDYAMPNISGTEFLRMARELCPNVPALIITGYAATEAIGDRPTGVEVLLKPFTPAVLESAIERAAGAAILA